MAADNNVNVNINANAKDASKNIDKFGKDASGTLDSIEKGFGAIKVVAAAAVAFFAGREVVNFFKDGISAAQESQRVMKALETQLDLTGEASEGALEAFEDFATQLERNSMFEADAVISNAALAKSYGLTNEEAMKLTQAAVELSTVTGDTLETSVKKLGKSLLGSTGDLGLYAGEVDNLTKAQLASGAAIDAVIKSLDGSAAASVNTFTGALQQLSHASGDVPKAFGNIIIENRAVIASIAGLGDMFRNMAGIVEENSEFIDTVISATMKSIAVSISVAVDVVGFFIRGFQGLTVTSSMLVGALADVVHFMGNAWSKTWGKAIDLNLAFLETMIELASKGGEFLGLEKFAEGADAAAKSVKELRESVKDTIDGSVKDIGKFADSSYKFAADSADAFEKFNGSYEAFGESVDELAVKVFAADDVTVKSAEKAAKARENLARRSKASADEYKKSLEEFKKFEQQIAESGASEFTKLGLERDKQLEALRKFYTEGVVSAERAAALKIEIEEQYTRKATEVQEKQLAEAEAALKESLDRQRALVEEAASNPAKSMVSGLEISPSEALVGMGEEIGVAAGMLNHVMSGRAGAEKFVSAAAGAAADAFLPGIGPVVSQITSVLAQGPEAVRSYVQDFVDAVPEVITAIADAAPEVVLALVDSLISKGGIVKIAVALNKAMLKLMTGEGFFKAAGKQLGLSFGSSFNSSNFSQTISKGFKEGVKHTAEGIKQLVKEIAKIPSLFFQGIHELFSRGPAAIADGAKQFVRELRTFFTSEIPKIVSGSLRAVQSGMSSVLSNVGGAIGAFFEKVRKEFVEGVLGGLLEAGRQAFGMFAELGLRIFNGLYFALRDFFDFFNELGLRIFNGIYFALRDYFDFFNELGLRIFNGLYFALRGVWKFFEDIGGAIWKGLKDAFDISGLLGGGGGDGGGFVKQITSSIGLGLTGGGTSSPYYDVPSSHYDDRTAYLLERLLDAVERQDSQPIAVTVQVGESELARAILNLNRQGFRTA